MEVPVREIRGEEELNVALTKFSDEDLWGPDEAHMNEKE